MPRSGEDGVFKERTSTFLSTVLGGAHNDTREDLLHTIAKAWRDYTDATWTWLWLFNEQTKEWELRSCSPIGQQEYIPARLSARSDNSVAQYCTSKREHVFVDTLDWSGEHKGKTYEVAAKDALRQMGCVAFESIPLVPPETIEESETGEIGEPSLRGALCAHYTRTDQGNVSAGEPIALLGEVAALAIQSDQQTHQRNILVTLSRVAEQHVHRTGVTPAQNRSDYLSELIKIIQTSLGVSKVSIFYKRPFVDTLGCLATTGIENRDGELVPDDRLHQVTYQSDQGLTGKVFKEGIPKIRTGEEDAHVAVWRETLDTPHDKRPVAIYPIRSASSGESVGVIRCAEKTGGSLGRKDSTFDSLDVQTLELISRQIGPILKCLDQNILREETIAQIKHDLYNPNIMARDAVARMTDKIEQKFPIDPNDLKAIATAVLLSNNLIPQLGYAVHERPEVDLQPTNLETDLLTVIEEPFIYFAREQKNISLSFDGFESIPELRIDRDLILRVLVNLLMNAIRYGYNHSKITVSASCQEGLLVVEVSDFGMGIDKEDMEAIFQSGFRSRAAKGAAFGSGLGLPIAVAAVEAHGGSLTLTSNRSPTTFKVQLPLVEIF